MIIVVKFFDHLGSYDVYVMIEITALSLSSLLLLSLLFYYLRQGGYVIVVVCLSVSNFAQKVPNGFAWNFQGRLAMGQWTND